MKLSDIEIQLLKSELQENNSEQKSANLWSLFSVASRLISIQLWLVWLFIAIVFYVGICVFPKILKQEIHRNKEANLYLI